jgi:hypothetical protein
VNNTDYIIFGDSSSIRDKGLYCLHEKYFWPVSENDFSEFYKFMYYEYIKIVKDENNVEINDIAAVEFSFISQLLQIFHYNYVREYSSIHNIEFLVGKESKELIDPNWDNIRHYYSKLTFPHGKVIRIIRRLIRNIVFNKSLPFMQIIYGLFSKPNFVSIGSMNQVKKDFIIQQDKFYNHVDWPDLLDVGNTFSDKKIYEFRELFVNNIIDPYLAKLREHNSFFIKNIDFNKIRNTWSERIFDAYSLYSSLKKSAISTEILITEMSKPLNKLITVAYQKTDCEVYCFHHGHNAAFKINELGFSINIAHCRNLIVPTNGIKTRYQKHYSNVNRITNTCTKFISVNSKKMYDTYLNNITNVVDKVDTIMIIGYPCHCNRYINSKGLFFKQQIDLEYQIISILRSQNKRIIYKAHPDRLAEVKGIFDDLVDNIITDSFENVWQEADLLIFTYSETTTFGYSLITNIPIILLDFDEDTRDFDDLQLIDKRIIRIPAKVGDNTQVSFDSMLLIEAVAQSEYRISYDYIKEVYGYS